MPTPTLNARAGGGGPLRLERGVATIHRPRCFIEFRLGMRRLIEDAIESLILFLDEIHSGAVITFHGGLGLCAALWGACRTHGMNLLS
jgi:hypothetical protein